MSGLIFDLDGLLFDSEVAWGRAEAAIAARSDRPWTDADALACIGGSIPHTAELMISTLGLDADPLDLVNELLDRVGAEFTAGRVEPKPGAIELLTQAQAAGIPVGLVSSTWRRLLNVALASLPNVFHVSVAGDEVDSPKPAPDGYLRGARALGLAPTQTVVLEDSVTGTRAAETAGALVVSIPDQTPVPSRPGRLVLGSLEEITVDALLALAAQRHTLWQQHPLSESDIVVAHGTDLDEAMAAAELELARSAEAQLISEVTIDSALVDGGHIHRVRLSRDKVPAFAARRNHT